MKISTKVQYASRALLDIAMQKGDEPVQLKDIAERQQMPLPYLEQIVKPLISAGFIKSVRGPHGGVYLAKEPGEVKLTEIVEAIEGPVSLVKCLSNAQNCALSGACVTQEVWSDVQKAIDGVLESITLKDLVKRHKEKAKTLSSMYYI